MKILIITQLDIEKMFNTTVEHHARGYVRKGCEVTTLYKQLNHGDGSWQMFKDAIQFRLRARPDAELDCFRFNPLFNYFSGFRANAEARPARPGAGVSLRLRLIRLASPLSALRDLFFMPCAVIAALLTGKGPWQVCVGAGPWSGLSAWVLKKIGRTRLMVYQDIDYEPGLVPYRLRSACAAAIERFCIARADLVCSTGFMLAERRRRESKRDVHVIQNGVDWARFSTARDTPRTGNQLVYVGNVVQWSGLENSIRALPRIREMVPDTRLRIVGDCLPNYRQHLQALVESLGLQHCVDFLGQRQPEELPALLAGGSIGLANSEPVPFRIYACPLKVMEYMAAGLAVVVTRDTEAEAIVEQYDCGLAADYDAESLAQSILQLLRRPDVLQAKRMNGIRASESLDWETLVSRQLELIQTVMAQRDTLVSEPKDPA